MGLAADTDLNSTIPDNPKPIFLAEALASIFFMPLAARAFKQPANASRDKEILPPHYLSTFQFDIPLPWRLRLSSGASAMPSRPATAP
jgi:hypothetical protein